MNRSFIGNIDIRFFARFIVVYYTLRMLNFCALGAIAPSGFYWQFAGEYLNYLDALQHSILGTAGFFCNLLGFPASVAFPRLVLPGGDAVFMAYACLGLNIMCFWLAFVAAHKPAVRPGIAHALLGILGIWLINATRVAVLLIATHKRWMTDTSIDHHAIFNSVSYVFIGLMMVWYYSRVEKPRVVATAVAV